GTRAAMKSQHDVSAPEIRDFLKRLSHEEAACCVMLARHVAELSGAATPQVGVFHQSAMAITDISVRLSFLNRGQGWIVRRLKEMLPRVRCDALHADLQKMLKTHERHIDMANNLVKILAAN